MVSFLILAETFEDKLCAQTPKKTQTKKQLFSLETKAAFIVFDFLMTALLNLVGLFPRQKTRTDAFSLNVEEKKPKLKGLDDEKSSWTENYWLFETSRHQKFNDFLKLKNNNRHSPFYFKRAVLPGEWKMIWRRIGKSDLENCFRNSTNELPPNFRAYNNTVNNSTKSTFMHASLQNNAFK